MIVNWNWLENRWNGNNPALLANLFISPPVIIGRESFVFNIKNLYFMKIVSTGATLFSEQHYRKRQEKRKKKFIIWSSSVILTLAALVLFSRLERFQIAEVGAEGARVITGDDISKNILDTLSGKYFWLVPKSNAVLYPRGAVKDNLMKEFPRISSAELSLQSPKLLSVSVIERDPYALYCSSESRRCFFLDKQGFIFDEAPDFSGVVYLVYSKEPSINEPKGREFLPPEEFSAIAGFIEGVSGLGFEPVSASIGERDAELSMKNGSRLIFDRTSDLVALLADLEAFLKNPAVEKSRLRELDLRIKNKIYWKVFGDN